MYFILLFLNNVFQCITKYFILLFFSLVHGIFWSNIKFGCHDSLPEIGDRVLQIFQTIITTETLKVCYYFANEILRNANEIHIIPCK